MTMEPVDLQQIASRSRSMREGGIALVFASLILLLFFFIPGQPAYSAPEPAAAVAAVATSTTPDPFANVQIDAKAAVVYDLADHKVLYAKNAEAQLPLASLTKLLTMYAAFSEFSQDTPITIPADVAGISEPHAFTPGQVFALGNLARLTLTASLNDGARSIAEAAAAREHLTVAQLLSKTAAALGLHETYAVDGSGLDMSKTVSGGYGSALDVAKLAGAFVAKEPQIASATTHPTATESSEQGISITVKNTDPIVANVTHLLLSKTGYTDLAGGNLVLVFDAGIEHPVAVVVLGSTLTSRFTDGSALIAATLAHFAGVASL